MKTRVLVAGLGDITQGDDGFGVEVVRRLLERGGLPEWVRVEDYGIRSAHLAYDLGDGGYEAAVLIDAVPQGHAPGALYVIEPEYGGSGAVSIIGERPKRVWIVGCEPAQLDFGAALSEPVARAVDEAVRIVCAVVERAGVEPS